MRRYRVTDRMRLGPFAFRIAYVAELEPFAPDLILGSRTWSRSPRRFEVARATADLALAPRGWIAPCTQPVDLALLDHQPVAPVDRQAAEILGVAALPLRDPTRRRTGRRGGA